MITKEEFVKGVIDYATSDVIPKLPTIGKWIGGAVVVMASQKANSLVEQFVNMPLAKSLGAVNSDGLIDEYLVLDALKKSASQYGDIVIPFGAGDIRFTASDCDRLKERMGRRYD